MNETIGNVHYAITCIIVAGVVVLLMATTIGNVHYAITCIIVAGVVVLLMATVYACHKENKRSIRWRNAHNRCQQEREQMITLRILQSLSQNRTHSRYYPDIVPLRTLNDPPPPYQPHYTPPPAYRETYQPTTYIPTPK
ncbi:unnamed protein product [Medioppia subpectinata]|uniref:Uncharacterized protein n=1 Tax=Medioppia subpectinata TaxID=1979941 RepID=A0A7R9LKC7_9ACAR|nr:unnamed protein product [Medioppia subpectinata]CAG2119576.1 unnamed protein product [Medioppia subpectinata]